jgi:hypothetical protein
MKSHLLLLQKPTYLTRGGEATLLRRVVVVFFMLGSACNLLIQSMGESRMYDRSLRCDSRLLCLVRLFQIPPAEIQKINGCVENLEFLKTMFVSIFVV